MVIKEILNFLYLNSKSFILISSVFLLSELKDDIAVPIPVTYIIVSHCEQVDVFGGYQHIGG